MRAVHAFGLAGVGLHDDRQLRERGQFFKDTERAFRAAAAVKPDCGRGRAGAGCIQLLHEFSDGGAVVDVRMRFDRETRHVNQLWKFRHRFEDGFQVGGPAQRFEDDEVRVGERPYLFGQQFARVRRS